jgi:glutaredoxin
MSRTTDAPMDAPTLHRVRWRLLGACLALLAMVWLPAQAGVYKWTDGRGVLHFSDRPPADATADRVQLRSTNSVNVQPPEAAPAGQAQAQTRRRVGHGPVVMFSAEWCGYCRKARSYFQANGVTFRERDVEKDSAARREYERLGGSGLPLILVGDKRLMGFSEESFRRVYDD